MLLQKNNLYRWFHKPKDISISLFYMIVFFIITGGDIPMIIIFSSLSPGEDFLEVIHIFIYQWPSVPDGHHDYKLAG